MRNLGVSLDGSVLTTPLCSSFKYYLDREDDGLKISSSLMVFFCVEGPLVRAEFICLFVSVSERTLTGGSYFNLLRSKVNP